MDERLQKAFNTKDFRKMGHEMVDLLANHLEQLPQQEKANQAYMKPDQQLEKWRHHFYEVNDKPMDLFNDLLPQLVHLHHPQFMGHQVGAPLPISALSEFFAGLLNNGMAVYEMGAPAAAMEHLICEWTAKLFGLNSGGGFLTSGGSLGNLTAILTAIKVKGTHVSRPTILVSGESHYCVNRATRIAGLGEFGTFSLAINEDRSIDVNKLDESLEQAKAQGLNVIGIVGNACSTATGTYDDLEALGEFAKKNDLWFHIDGAHGSAAICSTQHKHKLKGVELADSLVVDFHKMWLCSAPATAVIYKEPQDSYQTFSQQASYLWSEDESLEWYNLGKRTLECTKYMMCLKVYNTLKYYGPETIGAYIDQSHQLTTYFASEIKKRNELELFTEPNSNIICFRLAGSNNELNLKVRDKLLKNGDFYIVQTQIDGTQYFRCTLMSPFTTQEHIDKLLTKIVSIAEYNNGF